MQRRTLLKCLTSFIAAPAAVFRLGARTTPLEGFYLVDGWVLKASDLQELELDAV